MADKQVNININYKVNTVEVQKAEQLLKQAQTASTTFENSAKKAGQTTSQSFKTAGLSIQEMNAKLTVLKDRITQSTNPQQVKRLSDEYKKLKVQIDAANKSAFDTSKAIDHTSKSTQSLSGQLGGLYNAVKLAFTAGIIKEVVTTTLEMAKLSGTVEGVERAFARLPNSSLLLDDLRKSTHGTVGDLELMQKALTAQNFKIPLTQLATLLEFATVRAQQTGQEVNHLVDYIVSGIGLRSIKRLDDLGFTANRVKEALGGISLQAASTAQVMDALGKLMNEDLQKTGGYAETSATKVDQLNVSLTELKITLSQRLTQGGLIQFFIDAAKGANALASAIDLTSIRQTLINLEALANVQFTSGLAKEQARDIIKIIDLLGEENRLKEAGVQISNLDNTVAQYKDTIKANKERIATIKSEISALEDRNKSFIGTQKLGTEEAKLIEQKRKELESIEKSNDGYRVNKDVLTQVISILKEYENSLKNITDAGEEQLGIIEKLQLELDELGKNIVKARSHEEIRRLNDEFALLEARINELKKSTNQFNPLASVTFDIKKDLGAGKKKVETKDLIDTKFLENDTKRLFNKLGKDASDEFNKGLTDPTGITNLERTFINAKKELINASIDISANSLIALANMEADNYDIRLRQLSSYYDEQLMLAGDNQRAKEQIQLREKQVTDRLRREQARKEKQAAIYSIIISTAASIAKTAATLGYPAAIPGIIIAAAEGAAQLAVASRQSPGFKEGVLNLNGPGNGTSDSIPARLSKGESVMTAKEWKTSKNVLQEVRAKKLDDKVLADLKLTKEGVTHVNTFNDKNILSKLDEVKNSFPDIEERAGLVYTSKVKTKNYRMMVRKSSMSS